MQVIPAIDVLDSKAVRLRKGRYDQVTVYHDRPVELAREWAGACARLHVVDLEGARAGSPVQRDLIRELVHAFGAGVQVGGGVRSFSAVEDYVSLGVERVVLGTAALKDPQLVERAALAFPDRIILAVDARQGMVATEGWLEQSETRAVDLVQRFAQFPLAGVLYTDIDRDGTEVGPNVAETARLARATGVPVIASGGVGTLAHLRELGAAEAGIVAAIVGRALHESRFSILEAISAAEGPAGPRPE
ncbi:MAG TPA: 1-(5-phosphoribosyl)-5-[(5-phosphoribosylamino)methylideneamino]imidazole-4-carboxamide isomerase [Polyangiaceae bacterium]|nr:1-(5-phosphoribosyl)-5-[(5-phosphoribosylamino)methylideneamino]imidazole-4-carboxamide isomerase [Polyangiaceae bacterium]